MTTGGSMRKKKIKIAVGEPLIGLDLRHFDSYTGVKDIYHAVGRTSRTASEAFKDVEYATPIWRCSTDFDRSVHFLKQVSIGVFQIGISIIGIIFFIVWITKG
jgi:hypothetical protein